MIRVRNVSRQLLQELGREPTLEETARKARTTIDEARRVLAMSRYPISLDRPVGNSEDSYFGDLLPDSAAESPAQGAGQEMLRSSIQRVLEIGNCFVFRVPFAVRGNIGKARREAAKF